MLFINKSAVAWVLSTSTSGLAKSSCCVALRKIVSLAQVLIKSRLSCEFKRALRCLKRCK
jgi:hypothetical protein